MSLRILYVGNDLALHRYLQDTMDIKIVRCVGHSDALLLIKGIQYSAIVLDAADKEFEHSIRKVTSHKQTPVIIVYGSPESVVERLARALRSTPLT